MKKIVPFLLLMCSGLMSFSQDHEENPMDTLTRNVAAINSKLDVLQRLKISGYIQTQFQAADSAGQSSFAGGDFKSGQDKRFAVRRGRVKFTYTSPADERGVSTSQYVLQFDVTEKGMAIKDAYIVLTDKWSGWVQLKGGMFDRPFGYEIGYSSSMRESPERGRMSQIIFPGERDLGASIAIQGPKMSNWNWIRLEGGLFNGIGAPSAGADASDYDKKKDFIGRLSVNRSSASEKVRYGIGASVYQGGFRVDNDTIYSIATDSDGHTGYKVENGNFKGKYADRQYLGADAQLSLAWNAGITTLRAEYIQGEQTGTSSSVNSPRAVVTSNVYKRNFNGAYIYLVQGLGNSPFQAVIKYDWFDPNTDIEGDDIGKPVASGFKSTGTSDLRYDTWGFGLAYRWDANAKISAYYDMVSNETSVNIADASGKPSYRKDLKDNVFTLRLQIKF